MPRALPEAIVVPFGVAGWSPAEVCYAAVSRPTRAVASFPCLLLPPDMAEPLRLNNVPVDLFAGSDAPIDRADPLATLRDRIMALCDPWNHSTTLFLSRYFRAIEACVLADAEAIAAGSAGCPGLFEPRDWVYSAPCPLPRAHLRAPGGTAGEDYIAVDIAFWSGSGFIAVDTAPPRLLPNAARQRRERLAATGIVVIDRLPMADDPAAWRALFAALLAPPLTAFWQGEAVPLGCFRSDALDILDARVLGH